MANDVPMVTEREPQSALVSRFLSGLATEEDFATAKANFQRWLRDQWDGDAELASATCARALVEAGGKKWQALPERDLSAHAWLFSFACPRRDDLRGQAKKWVRAARRMGGAPLIAQLVRFRRG
ncbi:hypothetical protein [Streptomyces sp. FH025]|uniref:hypothetical protein n=1 Tax=Streptomyces sp. FH025 TaxID=2815937 RepID=UPI001A9EEC4D|nr:hypothetical protein [Streptomyces sp. FH025]MBO1417975.1 hypothetical protein [Streptomyces sp. FH025]